MAFDGVGDGQRRDNGRRAFDGRGDGLRRGGGEATATNIVIDGGGGGGLTAGGGAWGRRWTTKMAGV